MAPMFRFKLGESDAEAYGCAEWLDFDLDDIADQDVEVLERAETEIGLTLFGELPKELARGSIRGMRAALWLAGTRAGVEGWPAYRDFRPKLNRGELERSTPADVDPPANRAARRARKAPAGPTTTPSSGSGT